MGVPLEVSALYNTVDESNESSVPSGLIAAILLFVSLPNNFPNHHQPSTESRPLSHTVMESFQKVDVPGSMLLLTATIFLVVALEEAGVRFPWSSAFVTTLLTLSGILWIVFLTWEKRVTASETVKKREPVFPFRFLQSRVWVGMML